ncbi:DUF72 domain-containing protein [Alteromonas sp. KUL49]|uniref:DUF72 domain-containing protein n=1 Tax=Alteromonas sp. KUL49 TaxID=2480798 RepID=UPI0010FFAC17|nr:DUF72 domain-containing protein [Alteromonas sp. KUL49]GEA10323.1 hypothetical protein KUL49_06980 [Alteromonas sp. KUL49]
MTNQQFPHSNNNESTPELPAVFMGLPMWQHASWPNTWLIDCKSSKNQLEHYAKELNSIEGNTSFYALPSDETLEKWQAMVPAHFAFTCKIHKDISHNKLQFNEELLATQLRGLEKIKANLGQAILQLPAQFSPTDLPALDRFLRILPSWLDIAVEVRHLAFFEKGDAEIAFNQLLIEHSANRVVMDTRALFTGPDTSAMVTEVRGKKPRVPVNVIATGNKPMVRFVGNDNDEDNLACLRPWIKKIHAWRCEGKQPFMFFHRPDNKDAPWLAQQFINAYNVSYPEAALPELSIGSEPDQGALF